MSQLCNNYLVLEVYMGIALNFYNLLNLIKMKTLKIVNEFNSISDSKLDTRSHQILAALTDNPYFTSPVPTLVALAAFVNAFILAIGDCRDGDRLKVAVKNQKRAELIAGLLKLADYVLFKSAGNRVAALSSAFTIAKSPSPLPPITKPENFRIVNGINPGELHSKVNRVAGGLSYLHQYATDEMLAQENWHSVPSSKTSCIISRLEPGIRYHCRVAVLGAKGQLIYSDIVSRIVA